MTNNTSRAARTLLAALLSTAIGAFGLPHTFSAPGAGLVHGAAPAPAVGTTGRTAPAVALPAHVTPIPGWLHTDGTRIVDSHGRTVKLVAVNWYGAEGPDYVPGGLDRLPYATVLLTIKGLGFNAVRLPFSDELVERNPRVYRHLEANANLIGRHALDIMDAIIAGAGRAGLMVILDNHRSDAGWSALGSGRWYTPQFPESAWLHDWVTLAQRYRNAPAVVGVDLRNEPHSNGPGLEILSLGYLRQGATWGPYRGQTNPGSDWRQAAQRAGNTILRANPRLLIIVEGTEIYPNVNGTPDIYWWGANLRGALAYPIRLSLPHHLVYSAHEYGPQMHAQRWFSPHMTERQWDAEFSAHWGTLLSRRGPDAAPVWVGEFGTSTSSNTYIFDTRPASQGQWFSALVRYLRRTGAGWAYWAINGTMSSGPGGRQYGHPDSFGLLTPDWRHLASPALMKALRSIE